MAWNKIGNLAALTLALIFAACGGDSGSNSKSDTEELSQAETFDDLPNCSKNREGEIQTVVNERKTYQCIDGRWEEYGDIPDSVKTEDDLPACLEKNEGEIAFVSKDSSAWGCFDSRWGKIGKAYESVDNLPNCSEKRDGAVAYIMEDEKMLICYDGKWVTEKTDSPNQGGESKSEVKSSSSNKTSSSSVTEKENVKSSSSETKNSSSEKSSSSVQNTPSSSSIQSSDSAEPNVSYGTLTDERDGQKYKTVKIGEQIWMAENLNYDYKIDGKRYGSYCYDDELDSCAIYGRLYTWATAMDSAALFSDDGKGCGYGSDCNVTQVQGVCPDNWHLPSADEWRILFKTVSHIDLFQDYHFPVEIEGSSLRSVDNWPSENEGSNLYGFAAFPAGHRNQEGSYFNEIKGTSFFWIARNSRSLEKCQSAPFVLIKDSAFIYTGHCGVKKEAFSVRCIKNTSQKDTLYLDLSDKRMPIDFYIYGEHLVYVDMPGCGKEYNGNISCYDYNNYESKIEIGSVEYNQTSSQEIMNKYCGEKKVLMKATSTVGCRISGIQ